MDALENGQNLSCRLLENLHNFSYVLKSRNRCYTLSYTIYSKASETVGNVSIDITDTSVLCRDVTFQTSCCFNNLHNLINIVSA